VLLCMLDVHVLVLQVRILVTRQRVNDVKIPN